MRHAKLSIFGLQFILHTKSINLSDMLAFFYFVSSQYCQFACLTSNLVFVLVNGLGG